MSTVTPLEHTAIGAASGIVEVCIMQPTVAIKNALQEGRPVPRSIPALYRGLGMNMCSMFPITACQFGANRLLEQTYERVVGQRPGMAGSIAVAMGAGSASALLGCPAEFIVIHQQKTGRSLAAETASILRTYGPLKLYKGLSATAGRESLYTAAYLGLFPALKDYLQHSTPAGSVPGAPLVVGGIVAGMLGTTLTHPFDTCKTRMQALCSSEEYPQYRSLLSTARYILQTEGVGGFFAGLLPRAFRICGAVIILNSSRSTIVGLIDSRRGQAAAAAAEQ